ncbi:MAG: ABC transporter substrate-binding protein [Aeromicrobium sp.]
MFGHRTWGVRSIAALATVAIVAVGCSGASSTPSAAATPAPSVDASTVPSAEPSQAALPSCVDYGDVTLTVGFSEAGEAIAKQFRTLVDTFESQNPNVTVDLQAKDWASSSQTIKLAMSGDNPPDVMMGNEGWAINGALWQAGLILDLDPYAEQFGWFEEFPESALMVNRFSDDGKTMGQGNLVAVPPAMQYVGTFYNKEKLAALGVTDVSTIDSKNAFLAVLDQAKAAGEIPVMLGTSDKWPGLHNISLFNGWYVEPDVIKDWVFNVPGSTYETPGHLQGAADYRAWMVNGYYNDDALATSFSDAVARFVGGEGVFYIGGTWALGDISTGLGEKAGFMLFPAGESGKHAAVGGYSLPWTISSKSPVPDCAAAFVDFVTASPEAIQTQIAAGRPSAALAGADAPIESPLLQDMVREFDRLTADGGLFTWEDWPTPSMFTLMQSEAQLLLGGQTSPEEYAKRIQANWDDFMASR